ncbi:integrase [Campylobacterota bacterium]|nr:integrase [Campylobacterota bacterium]
MAFGKLILADPRYDGVFYYNDTKRKRKAFVIRFTHEGKQYKRLVGYDNGTPRMTVKAAWQIRELEINKAKDGYTESKPVSFNKVFETYLDSIAPIEAQRTIASKKYNHTKHIVPYIDDRAIGAYGEGFWQSIINRMLAAGCKPTTAQKVKNQISKVYDCAIAHKWASVNPTKAIKLPKYDDRVEVSITLEESKRLYKAIIEHTNAQYRGIFTFLLHGRRLNEVLSLEWSMIDFDKGLYAIPARINKVRRAMQYSITALLQKVLDDQKALIGIVPRSPLVFPNAHGKKFVDLKKVWKGICKTAGIEQHLRIHDIRHIIGNLAANNGIDELTLASILGHTSTRITKRYYQVQAETAARGIEKILGLVKE